MSNLQNVETDFSVVVKNLADKANKNCGLSYELYERRFVTAIECLVIDLPNHEKQHVIQIAKQYGYTEESLELEGDSDCCSHGIDRNCCPAGCGEHDDTYHESMDAGYQGSAQIDNKIDRIEECIRLKQRVSPIEWSNLKLFVHNHPDAIKWYKNLFIDSVGIENNICNATDLIDYFKENIQLSMEQSRLISQTEYVRASNTFIWCFRMIRNAI